MVSDSAILSSEDLGKDVTKTLQRRYKHVTKTLQRRHKDVTKTLQDVTKTLQRRNKDVTKTFQRRYKDVTLLHNNPTACGDHMKAYSVGNMRCFPEGKSAGTNNQI
jgi:uncharacterized protein YbbK (DUF523 family)